MSSNPNFTLGDLFGLTARDNVLTPEVVTMLAPLHGRQLSDLAALNVISLASVIRETSQNITDPLVVAGRLQESIALAQKALAPIQRPQTIPLNQMTVSELLAYIVTLPEDYEEAVVLLENKPQVIKAAQKTGGAWVIPALSATTIPGVDVSATHAYIAHLASNPYTQAQREFQNREPITLETALGRNARPMIHPFTLEPVLGPVNGHDLADLSAELHEALLWAQSTSPHHPAWPDYFDAYQRKQAWNDIFTKPLPEGRWADILRGYQSAKAKDEELHVSRFMPRDLLGRAQFRSLKVQAQQPVFGEAHYKELLEERALSTLERSGMDANLSGICQSIRVSGMDPFFHGLIVLQGGAISSMNARGTIYVPRGVDIKISGMNCKVSICPCTYQELARRAGLI